LLKLPDRFQLNSLVAQVLFVQLHEHTESRCATQSGVSPRSVQTGHARRSFARLFEPLSAIERVRLFENLLRFANYEAYLPARAYFLAYAPLSFEHDVSGEYIGPGVCGPAASSRTASLRVDRTLKRWCDWLEALTHFQVHQIHHTGSPLLALDKAIIFLWPLLKRHDWSYADLLGVLRSITNLVHFFPGQSPEQFAAYCQSSLGLRRRSAAKPARSGCLPGQVVAERLFRFLPVIS
jgi:hypothetical protein